MLTLTLWNSAEDVQHTIELYEHAPVNLNYQFTDISEINKSKGSYTQTFRIPATKQNTDFFGAIDNPSVVTASNLIIGNYNIKKKIVAALSYNSIPLMRGYVQIKAVYKQKKDFADIELVFFGDVVDMASKVGDAMLSDLTTSTINHTLNDANIAASWVGTSALPFDKTIRYGMMDKGQNWGTAPLSPPWSPTGVYEGGNIYQGDLTPYIQAKWLFNAILDEAGFTYTSVFIDGATFDNVYLPAYNGGKYPRSTTQEPEGQLVGVSIASDMTLADAPATVEFLDNVGGHNGYDYGSNWNNVAFRFNAPYTAQYTFTLNQLFDGGDAVCHTEVWAQVNGTGAYTQIHHYPNSGQNTFSLHLQEDERLYIKAGTIGAPTAAEALIAGAVGSSGSWFRMDSCTEALTGQTVGMAQNFPEIKQIDFLMGLQKMFNLIFVSDKNIPNHLIIEPFADYTASGTVRDWSNKIDYTKDIVIRPTTDIQKKEYDWTHDAGQDFINVLVKAQTDRNYGRFRVTDPDNDFAAGSLTIQTPFAPYLMSHIPYTNFVIHRCITNDGAGVKTPKPRIAFWCGTTALMGDLFIRDDDMSPDSNAKEFPVFSNYSSVVPVITDDNLNFGYERDFFYVEAHPLNGLYYKYWSAYVNELYSASSRLLTAYVKLTYADIQAFEFSDRIYIRDAYYRILKISNFDATQGGVTKVEFIKELSGIADCADIPTSVNTDNTIRFNSTYGDYGTQKCCEKYGYVWRPRLGRCYPNSSTAQSPTIT